MDDFASPKELAEYLRELSDDEDKFIEYLQWQHYFTLETVSIYECGLSVADSTMVSFLLYSGVICDTARATRATLDNFPAFTATWLHSFKSHGGFIFLSFKLAQTL